MAAPNPSDPFLVVQADVLTTLSQTRTLYSSYLRIRSLASSRSPATNPELTQARSDLEANLDTVSADVAELLESVRAVEGDPYRFGMDSVEVQRRRGFISDVKGEVDSMRAEIQGGSGSTHIAQLPSPNAFDEDGDDDAYANFEQQTQATMMREQDEQLDEVGRTVGVLRGQAQDMGRELEEQGGMLDEVDVLADRVGGKLSVGVKKVGEVIKRNEESVSSCCIGVLVVVLIILLILVIVL
jgi:member of the syntaxin family of t-SNAREs